MPFPLSDQQKFKILIIFDVDVHDGEAHTLLCRWRGVYWGSFSDGHLTLAFKNVHWDFDLELDRLGIYLKDTDPGKQEQTQGKSLQHVL